MPSPITLTIHIYTTHYNAEAVSKVVSAEIMKNDFYKILNCCRKEVGMNHVFFFHLFILSSHIYGLVSLVLPTCQCIS